MVISWASTWPDPYATNTLLDEDVVLEMWDIVYPDIELEKQKRMDTGVKLVYLVSFFLAFVMNDVNCQSPGRTYTS
jgi:hypothetical protein